MLDLSFRPWTPPHTLILTVNLVIQHGNWKFGARDGPFPPQDLYLKDANIPCSNLVFIHYKTSGAIYVYARKYPIKSAYDVYVPWYIEKLIHCITIKNFTIILPGVKRNSTVISKWFWFVFFNKISPIFRRFKEDLNFLGVSCSFVHE